MGRIVEDKDQPEGDNAVDEAYDDSPWTDEEMDLLRAEACELLDSFGKPS